MSEDPGPGAPGFLRQEALDVLRRLLALRQEELELLHRLEQALQGLAGRESEGSPVRVAGDAERDLKPPAGETATESAGALPSWIEEAVQGALSRAFSGSEEADPQPENVAPAADPSLLLLGDEEILVGIPWEQVEEVGLAEESGQEGGRWSLRQLLKGPTAASIPEPYRVRMQTPSGPLYLSCGSLGGVLAASVAAGRGVEAVLVPSPDPACGAPVLVPLIEFLVRPVPVEAKAEPAVVEPIEAPVERPIEQPIEQPMEHPEPVATPGGIEIPPALETPATRSALLAVRYLPARVAIGRAFRADGWSVSEAIDAREVLAALAAPHEVVLIEIPENPSPDLFFLLRQAVSRGAVIVGVRSRIRGAGIDPLRSLGEVPQLLYPFQETELDRIVRSFRPSRTAS